MANLTWWITHYRALFLHLRTVQTSSKQKTHLYCFFFSSFLQQMGVQVLQIHRHNSPVSPQNKTFPGGSRFKNHYPAGKELHLYCVDKHINPSLSGFFFFLLFIFPFSSVKITLEWIQPSLLFFNSSCPSLKKKKKKIFQKKKKKEKRKSLFPS